MKKKLAVYHHMPIYGRNIFFSSDIEAVKKLILEYYKEDKIDVSHLPEEGTVHGFVCPITAMGRDDFTHAYIMHVAPKCDAGVVAHEANHLKNFIWDYLGLQLCLDDDEGESYMVGYIVAKYMELIRGEKPSYGELKKLRAKK